MKKIIFKPRKKDSHKGDYGHVFVLAGSPGLTGAAYLCSQAAIFSGCGLVTLGIPKSLNPIMEAKLTEVMTLPLAQTQEGTLSQKALPQIKKFITKKIDAIALGPGLSSNKTTQLAIRKLLIELTKPLVIDADGINALVGSSAILKRVTFQIPLW